MKTDKHSCIELMEQIAEECQQIINTCNNNTQPRRTETACDKVPMHYRVQILKYQPTKVHINGKLEDRLSLSANEREAVRTQEQINKLRAQRALLNMLNYQNNFLQYL